MGSVINLEININTEDFLIIEDRHPGIHFPMLGSRPPSCYVPMYRNTQEVST